MSATCNNCNGVGSIETSRVDGSGGFIRVVTDTVPCAFCNGTGSVTSESNQKPNNGYAQAARQRKAWHLYDAANRLDVHAKDIENPVIRDAVLACARLDGAINNPSEATWAVVAEHLAQQPTGENA